MLEWGSNVINLIFVTRLIIAAEKREKFMDKILQYNSMFIFVLIFLILPSYRFNYIPLLRLTVVNKILNSIL
jgi:uncharacterized membrane protein YjdF